MELCLSEGLGYCSPFLFRVFLIAPWDSLSGLCALWDSLSSSPSLWLGKCTLGWPVWLVIGFPLLGIHPSISIVKLIMIGYRCNCLDGQLNCRASAHWLIGATTCIDYAIGDWAIAEHFVGGNSHIIEFEVTFWMPSKPVVNFTLLEKLRNWWNGWKCKWKQKLIPQNMCHLKIVRSQE